jgi:hypothetical protein
VEAGTFASFVLSEAFFLPLVLPVRTSFILVLPPHHSFINTLGKCRCW